MNRCPLNRSRSCRGPLAVIALISAAALPAAADVHGPGPSDPSLFDTVINLPPDPDIGHGSSIGGSLFTTTQLNVRDSGTIGNSFQAYSGSEVNIYGGYVGGFFNANSKSEINISGGTVGDFFRANADSAVNITGGSFGSFNAYAGSTVNIDGGTLGAVLSRAGSVVSIGGGTHGRSFTVFAGSQVKLVGGEYMLNGTPYAGDRISLLYGDVLTGTLSDGSSFIHSQWAFDDVTDVELEAVPLPAAGTTPIRIDRTSPNRPSGLRPGQTLTLQPGGLLGDSYEVANSKLNIAGGDLGVRAAAAFSEVNISGGNVGHSFHSYTGSEFNVSDGNIGGGLKSFSGSTTNISGGVVGDGFDALSGSVVNISGGAFGTTRAFSGSAVNLYGTAFFADGEPLNALTIGKPYPFNNRGITLSGMLADGSLFEFDVRLDNDEGDSFASDATLTLTLVSSNLPGDYNGDGVVDAADYTVWRDAEGKAIALINETVTPGQVTIEDYNVWLANYGATLPVSTSVPEPSAWGLALIAGAWGVRRRDRRA